MKYPLLLDGLLLVLSLVLLQTYLQWNSLNFLLGIPALWLFWKQSDANQQALPPKSYALSLILLFLLLCLTIRVPVQTLFYLSLVVYFIVRSHEEGKSETSLLFFVALLMSPLAEYFFRVFSFPLRLWISKTAVSILQLLGEPVKAIGNVIDFSGKEFSVDMACMGLNLTTASLLCGLLLLLVLQRKTNRKLGLTWLLIYLMAVFCLNVLANLIRILLLVKFQLFPDNSLHEAMGLISLLVYVCIPSWWLAGVVLNKFGSSKPFLQKQKEFVFWKNSVFPKTIVYMLFLIGGWRVVEHKQAIKPFLNTDKPSKVMDGFELTNYSAEVLKLSGKNELVYLKRIPDFFTPEHSPLICWQGSGYQLQKITEIDLKGFRCYTAELILGKQQLYTAWWFDNGYHRTNSQLNWRWDSFRTGNRYCLVNCTVSNKEALRPSIQKLIGSKGFRHLIVNL